MQRRQYLAQNTLLFALNSIGTKLIIFFMVPVYTQTLTQAEYGIVDVLATIALVVVPIITLNINEAVMRFSLDEAADTNRIMSVGLVMMALSVALGFAILPVASLFENVRPYRWMVYCYCVMQGFFAVTSCYLRGKELLLHYAICNIATTLCAAVLNIVFLKGMHMGIAGYFYAYIIAYAVGTIYAMAAGQVQRVVRRFKLDGALARKMISYSILLVPNSLMWWIMNSSDRIMVIAMINEAANGVYAVSYKIPSLLSTMSTVFNQAWAYSAIHEEGSVDSEEYNNQTFDAFVQFQMLLTAFLLAAMRLIMKYYAAPAFYEAWKYTPYLLVGYFFMSLGTFVSTSYTVNKDSRGFLHSSMIGACMNIALNWLLIPHIGVSGAALATAVSYVAVFVFRLWDTRKYLKLRFVKVNYAIGTLLLVAMAFTMYLENRPMRAGLFAAEMAGVLLCTRGFIAQALGIARKVLSRRSAKKG